MAEPQARPDIGLKYEPASHNNNNLVSAQTKSSDADSSLRRAVAAALSPMNQPSTHERGSAVTKSANRSALPVSATALSADLRVRDSPAGWSLGGLNGAPSVAATTVLDAPSGGGPKWSLSTSGVVKGHESAVTGVRADRMSFKPAGAPQSVYSSTMYKTVPRLS